MIKLTSTCSPSSTARYRNPPCEQLVTPRGAQLTAARKELAAEAGTLFAGEGRGGRICLPPDFFKISAEYVINRSLTQAFEILPILVIQKVINLLLGLYIIPPIFCLCLNCEKKIH